MDYTINIFSLTILIILAILFAWNFYTNKRNIHFIEKSFKFNNDILQILRNELKSKLDFNHQLIQKLETNIYNLEQKTQATYDEYIKLSNNNLKLIKDDLQNNLLSNQNSIQKLENNINSLEQKTQATNKETINFIEEGLQNLQGNFDKELNKILDEIKSPLNLD